MEELIIGAPLRVFTFPFKEAEGSRRNKTAEEHLDAVLAETDRQLQAAETAGLESNLNDVRNFQKDLQKIKDDLAKDVPSHWLARLGDSKGIGDTIAKLDDRVNKLINRLTLALVQEGTKSNKVVSRFLLEVGSFIILSSVAALL